MSEETLDELLKNIQERCGAYSRNHLEHAENCINEASENAKKIREELVKRLKHMVREAENNEIADVRVGIYSLLKDLGVQVLQDEYGDYYLREKKESLSRDK